MTSQDFERLSAYIDGQLSPGEKAALEARLARDPELQRTLRELRLTVRTLRSLPAVKPPRSFTLTPAQVGQAGRRAQRGGWFPALRLAAALSAVVLAVLITVDLSTSRGLPTAALSEDGAAQVVVTEMAEAEVAEEAAPAAEAFTPTPTEAGEAAIEMFNLTEEGVAAGADEPPTETPAAAGLLGPQPTPTLDKQRVAPTLGPDDRAGAGLMATPTPEAKALDATAPEGTEVAAYAAETAAPFEPDARREAIKPGPSLSPLRVAEAALAMLTVMLALAAWFARGRA